LARWLVQSFVLLSLVAVGIAFTAVWTTRLVDRTMVLVAARKDKAILSARIRSECLTLTELTRRYTMQIEELGPADPDGSLLDDIIEKQAQLDSLIQQASQLSDPNDVDEGMLVGSIRQDLVAFSTQAGHVIDAYDQEQAYGQLTRRELADLVLSYQDPLIFELSKFEQLEIARADEAQTTARQVVGRTLLVLSLLTVAIFIAVVLLTLQVTTRLVAPLARLRGGVEAIRQGHMDHPVVVHSQDELGALASALNSMAADLNQSRLQLETYARTLEDQVAERTAQLEQRAFELERLAMQSKTAAEISQFASGTLDLEELLAHSVQLIAERFELYYVGLFLVDETYDNAWLRAANGAAGAQMLAERYHLSLLGNSMIAWCIRHNRPRVARIASADPERLANPLLPETRSEAALPLVARGEAIGALTVQSQRPDAFLDADMAILQTMVGQLANAIGNARLYQAVQLEKQHAESANRAKSAFLANVSHEIRTPMNAMLGFAELLMTADNLTTDQLESLRTIRRSGETLLALINSILDLSKIEAGRMVVHDQAFDLTRLLTDLENLFSLRFAEKNLPLLFHCAADVPIYIRTDEHKLHQVLINLIGNALKFTRQGRVEVQVRPANPVERLQIAPEGVSHPAAHGSPTVPRRVPVHMALHFSVADTGIGITPQELAEIFQPFTQTTSGRELHQGTGLGLAICQQFVRLLGGELSVQSTLGQGSTFAFVIPVQVAEMADVPAARTPYRVLGLAPGQRSYRLLVVDDQLESRQWVSRLLTSYGLEVRQAVNGEEAIQMWQSWQPHLIWMDMRMPVLDGSEATRRIKALPGGAETIIVALTASAFEEDRARLLAMGCNDFLRKPVSPLDLVSVLEKHLGVHFQLEDLPAEAEPASTSKPAPALLFSVWQTLPGDWIAALRQAAVEADFDQINDLVAQISSSQPELAERIISLTRNYDVRGLLALLPPTH
jgi:signal transduction histidine kinase/DNA-binding response OmpR family regulator/HAMP domain-containing protein